MTRQTVTFRGSRDDLYRLLRGLPAALAGKAPDPQQLARSLQLRLGVALLSKVQQAFVIKSRGGVGEDGILWKPLAISTVAGRRETAQDKRLSSGLRARSPTLTDTERKAIEKDIRRRTADLMARFGLSKSQAKGLARAAAEASYRRTGAIAARQTMLGNRPVDILRDTGELFRSFSPGVEDRPSGAEGQIFQIVPGSVIIGTNKKPWHHQGVPGKLPARPFWPPGGQLPDAWWDYLLGVYLRGLLKALETILR